MPVQIPALPPIQSPVSNIGMLLSALGQGYSKATDPNDPDRLKIQLQKEQLAQEKLKSLATMFQYMPPTRAAQYIPQILASLGLGDGAKPSMPQPAGGATAPSGGVAAPSPSTDQTGIPPTYDEWLAQHSPYHSIQDVPPAFANMYDRMYQEEMSRYTRMSAIQNQAREERDQIMSLAEKPTSRSAAIGPLIDQFNSKWGKYGIQIDKNGVFAQMTQNYNMKRGQEITQDIRNLRADLQRAIDRGDTKTAGEIAGQLQERAASSARILGISQGRQMSPAAAIWEAEHSEARQSEEYRREQLRISTQRLAMEAQRLTAQIAHYATTRNQAATAAAHADLRQVSASLTSEVSQHQANIRDYNNRIAALQGLLAKPTSGNSLPGDSKKIQDAIQELTAARSAEQNALVEAQTEIQRIRLQLDPNYVPPKTGGTNKPDPNNPAGLPLP